MVKKVTAVLLILITGGVWIYLDYLNKQELAMVEQTRQEFLVIHAQAKERFKSLINTDLGACQAAAEKTKNDYVAQNQITVPNKPGQFTIPQLVADEAARLLSEGNAACQRTFDRNLRSGS
jgi:hypothetical protein